MDGWAAREAGDGSTAEARRRPGRRGLLAAVGALAAIALGVGAIALGSDSTSDDGTADAAEIRRPPTSSPGPSTTTTTSPPPGRATSDPAHPPYQAVPLPAGISASLPACTWSPDHGGELQASGTISSTPGTNDFWLVEVFWLQNDRELESQSNFYELPPGQATTWRLTVAAPVPPLDLRCALEVS
jgi:hypothetical protein